MAVSDERVELSAGTVDVLREFVRDGGTNTDVARRLYVSPSTVRWHLARAMRLTGTHTRTALALWWIRVGQYGQSEPDGEASHAAAPSPRS